MKERCGLEPRTFFFFCLRNRQKLLRIRFGWGLDSRIRGMSNFSVTFISMRVIRERMEGNSCHGPTRGSGSWLPVSHREGPAFFFFPQASTRGICGEQSNIKTFFYPSACLSLINRHCAILVFYVPHFNRAMDISGRKSKMLCYLLTPTVSVQSYVQEYFGETNSVCGSNCCEIVNSDSR